MPPIIPQPNAQLTLFSLTKTCKGCGLDKPTGEFYKSSQLCGFTSRCKVCHDIQVKAKYLENHEENKAKARDRANAKYQQDPEFHREKSKQWRLDNLDKSLEMGRAYDRDNRDKRQAYRKANAERRKAYQRVYNKANQERRAVYGREYYQKNAAAVKSRIKVANLAKPEFYADIHRRWKKANPDACRAMKNNRRTRLTGSGGSYTAQEWTDLKASLGNRCLMCNRPESEVFLTFDHIIPVSDGGTSDISNGQSMCRSCNSKKHTKTLDLRPK